jgi:hypothetical protein
MRRFGENAEIALSGESCGGEANLPAEVATGAGGLAVVTLAIFGQWGCGCSERDCFRYAQQRLRAAFPTRPHRTQCNRGLRRHQAAIVAFDLSLE